jgi:outer membrane receptor protein involved in Fe transport
MGSRITRPPSWTAGCVLLTAMPCATLAPRAAHAADATRPTVVVEAPAQPGAPDPFTPVTAVSQAQIELAPGASRSNSLAMITDFVPGAYMVHDQLHLRGGHQVTWAVDGIEIPNTNIGSNVGPQIDPKDIERLEVERGSYGASEGDRTYGIFNILPRTGVGQRREGELIASGGSYGQTNDYLGVGSQSGPLAYYVSVNGNRSGLGLETPVPEVIHDAEEGYGGFATLVYAASPGDQVRLVTSLRRDEYQIPIAPGDPLEDVQHEADAFGILSWSRTFRPGFVLRSAAFYHYNRADLDGGASDFPTATTDHRSSTYAGGQEDLRWRSGRNELRAGLLGFAQQDEERFGVIFNDGSGEPIRQAASPAGYLIAAYLEDTFEPVHGLDLTAGLRQTHLSGAITENASSPRIGATYELPALGWMLRAFWGRFYQAPPLDTLSGPLLQYASSSDLGFLPLHGERDEEWQAGLTVPVGGWAIDADYFHTRARNFFDHNPLGNSNLFLPLTIDAALIRGTELAIRSPRLWGFAEVHLAWSNQTADGFGAVSGGLTDFSPPEGGFALDHDQRNTVDVGVDARLPAQAFLSLNVYCGSGFASGDPPPSHLPSHARLDLSAGKAFGERLSVSVTVLNVTDRRVLLDDSLTFGGFHYDDPRQIYAELQYRFGY